MNLIICPKICYMISLVSKYLRRPMLCFKVPHTLYKVKHPSSTLVVPQTNVVLQSTKPLYKVQHPSSTLVVTQTNVVLQGTTHPLQSKTPLFNLVVPQTNVVLQSTTRPLQSKTPLFNLSSYVDQCCSSNYHTQFTKYNTPLETQY